MTIGRSSTSYSRGTELPNLLVDSKQGVYKVGNHVGNHASGSKVYEAIYCPKGSLLTEENQVLGLLVVEDGENDIVDVFKGVMKNKNCDHVNVLEVKEYFYFSNHLCVSLPLIEVKSLRYVMYGNPRFRNGFPEDCIAFVLRETICGLSSVHEQGEVHGKLTCGQIFWDKSVRKLKIGYEASLFDRQMEASFTSESDFPIWSVDQWAAPPEAFKNRAGHTTKSDSWLIGIVALELAFGRLQMYDREEFLGFVRWVRGSKRLPSRGETWELSPEIAEQDDRKGKILKSLRHVKRVASKYMNPRYLLARSFSRRYKMINDEGEMVDGDEDEDENKKGPKFIKYLKDRVQKVPVPGILKSKINELCCFEMRKKVKTGNNTLSAFSESFSMLVADCLDDDPAMRPSLWELSQYEIIRKCRSTAYFEEVIFKNDEEI